MYFGWSSVICILICVCRVWGSDDTLSTPINWDDYDFTSWSPIIWFAPFFSSGGYCSEAISFFHSLSHYIPNHIYINQHGDGVNQDFIKGLGKELKEKMFERMIVQPEGLSDRVVAICHSEPGAWHPANYQTSRCPPTNAYIKIGRTMFETDRLPKGWERRLNAMDSIWVPTHFHSEIFASNGVSPSKLVVVPEPVDVDFYDRKHARIFKFPHDKKGEGSKFRFLSIFKFEDRKGWQFLLEAYYREFSASDPVELNILTSAYHSDADFESKIGKFRDTLNFDAEKLSSLPAVHILPSGIPTTKMTDLYASSDCFVLPSRGEGWGRPHVESMSMSLPIIATYWSGTVEYMTYDNSYPLNIESELDEIIDGPFKGHKWARPSVSHLRQLMRHVMTYPEEAKAKGVQARKDMVEKYCPTCVAKIVLHELEKIIASKG